MTTPVTAFLVLFAALGKSTHVYSLVSKPHVGSSSGRRLAFANLYADKHRAPHVGSSTGRRLAFANLYADKHRAPLVDISTGARATSLHAISPVAWSAIGHVLGGTTGAPIVAKAINSWYKKIDLPPWTPPDGVFAPTWTILYALMGVAAGRVFQRVGGKSVPIILWACHYLLNLSWAPVFFGRKRLRLGLVINYFLLTSLAVIIPMFYQIDALSGKLLLPYFAWISFATALNVSICSRNPSKDAYNNAMFQSDLASLQDQAAEYAGV